MKHYPKIAFTVDSHGHRLAGDRTPDPASSSSVLFLHGAGQITTREFFDPIRAHLFAHQIPSAAFDFIGHGETGGSLQSSSLLQRFNQSCDVIESLSLSQPLSIVASSMSGYTAIKLLEKYQIENLILIVPAAYHAGAFRVPFDQGFSDLIRQPQSWLHTDAWEILKQYRGNLLLITAENDEVVPNEINKRMYDSAVNAHKKWHVVPYSPHKVLTFLAQHPEKQQIVNSIILHFLIGSSQ